ncbi:MAG: ABC transporter permease, partial [Candidatus Heimdallarchaeota archaeon]
MTEQSYKKEILYQEQEPEFSRKKHLKRFLKFYLTPGWRNPEFLSQEYQIEKIKSKRRRFRRLLRPLTISGMIMIIFILILAVYTPWLTSYPLDELVIPYIPPGGDPFDAPSALHPLGTTQYGYDVLARIIWGARTTILMALIPVTISIGGGLILGTISAYFGGTVDYVMMRFVDLMYAFPNLIL